MALPQTVRSDSVSGMERYGVRCVIAAHSQLQFQLQNRASVFIYGGFFV